MIQLSVYPNIDHAKETFNPFTVSCSHDFADCIDTKIIERIYELIDAEEGFDYKYFVRSGI